MSKRREEKILDEIRRRVIDIDRQKQEQHDEKEIRKANLQALSELTSMSQKEIEEIESKVREEEKKKYEARRKKIIYISILAIIIAFIGYKSYSSSKNKFHLMETFTDNQNEWGLFDDFKYKRYYEKGNYVFETNYKDWCYWDHFNIKLPDNYTIEVKSTWMSGKFDAYGPMLYQNDSNYCSFTLTGNGDAAFSYRRHAKWEPTGSSVNVPVISRGLNTQKIEMTSSNYKYYINGKFVKSGVIKDFYPKNIGMRNCGEQKVGYSYFKVTDNKNNKVIFEDSFNPADSNKYWTPKELVNKKTYFEDGKYFFKTDADNGCYWSLIPVPEDQEYEVSVKSQWIKGETADYGLIYYQDDSNYITFELTDEGKARMALRRNAKWEYVSDYIKTDIKNTGKNANIQSTKISKNKIVYYVNKKEIARHAFDKVKVNKIGMRVCGKQTIAFDDLKIDQK